MPTLLLLSLLTTPAAGVVEVQEGGERSVLVLDFKSTNEGSSGLPALVRDQIASQLSRRAGTQVMTAEDIERISGIEAERQAAGCDESSCLAEIAGAIGADTVVYGTTGEFPDLNVINVVIFDARTAESLGRFTVKEPSVAAALERLHAEMGALLEEPSETPAQASSWSLPAAGWTLAGVGGVALLVGGGGVAVAETLLATPPLDRGEKERAEGVGRVMLVTAAVGAAVTAAGIALLVAAREGP